TDTENSFRERTGALEADHHRQLDEVTQEYQAGLAAAEQEANEARTRALVAFDGEATRATEEMAKVKRAALHRYADGKEAVQAEFQETRWTVTTVYDAGRKNAKDQLAAAQERARLTCEQLE